MNKEKKFEHYTEVKSKKKGMPGSVKIYNAGQRLNIVDPKEVDSKNKKKKA